MNLVSTALLAMLAEAWVYPSGDDTGATDPVNVQAAISAYGLAILSPGAYYGSSTVTGTTAQYVIGPAGRRTTWYYSGAGPAFQWTDASVYDDRTAYGGGLLGTFTVDGTSAGAGACGLEYDSIAAGQIDIAVQNFSGAGMMGVHFDNFYYFTEETRAYVWAENCTQHVVFDVDPDGEDTATNSFGYGDYHFQILAKTGQDGVVLQNGAVPYNCTMKIRANFQGSTSAQSSAVLRITGTVPAGHPGAGGYSALKSASLNVHAECTDETGTNAPYTIYFGSLSDNAVLGCYGGMDFAQGSLAFTESNWTATGAAGGFIFDGPVRGDFNLDNATVGLSSAYSFGCSSVRTFGKSLLNVVNGNIQVNNGDYFQNTLSGNTTLNLNPGGAATFATAQHKVLAVSQPSTGGTYDYTLTWPHTASPTTTDCSVVWAGGVAPTMSTGAGATDVYYLDTYNGATWYGSAQQNVS